MRFVLLFLLLTQVEEGWQYTVTDARTTPPGDEVEWQSDADPNGRDLWYRNTLRHNLPDGTRLAFRAYVGELTIFLEQQPLYSFTDPESRGKLTFHLVELPHGASGRRIYVRVPNAKQEPFVSDPYLFDAREQPEALRRVSVGMLRDDLFDIIVGSILVVIGVISLEISRLRLRTTRQALPWFGAMSALYGARLIADSYLPLTLGASVTVLQFVEAWITYVLPITGWMLAWRLIGDGWKQTLRWQVILFVAFAPIGIISDIVAGRPSTLETVNNVLVITGGINMLFNLFYARSWKSRELQLVLAGSVLFLLFALANNLDALGLISWTEDEVLGFVGFVATLGSAAAIRFARDDRERAALETELATAREIQQSILPAAMPSVAGLRFETHYDPASSVAGDLYDFLRGEDGRVGVLVADVSGHGVPAALVASMVKVAVSSHLRLAHDPRSLLREVNRTLRGNVRRAFVTATMLAFDRNQSVEVVNAGHPPPLLLRDGAIHELGTSNMILGRFDATFTSESIALQPGDRILAYTDGVNEARNERGEEFGEERLHDLLRRGASSEAIASEVRAWRGDAEDADDVTLVLIEVA